MLFKWFNPNFTRLKGSRNLCQYICLSQTFRSIPSTNNIKEHLVLLFQLRKKRLIQHKLWRNQTVVDRQTSWRQSRHFQTFETVANSQYSCIQSRQSQTIKTTVYTVSDWCRLTVLCIWQTFGLQVFFLLCHPAHTLMVGWKLPVILHHHQL